MAYSLFDPSKRHGTFDGDKRRFDHEEYNDCSTVDPKYIENPREVPVHDTMGREPTIDFEEGVKCVCEPYKDSIVTEE